MGTIMYGHPDTVIEFDDRVLRHLKSVIMTKLRRGEAFTLHYANTSRNGSGHTVLWLHPAIGLRFHFDSVDARPLNRAWIAALMESANNSAGLVVSAEPLPGGAEVLGGVGAASGAGGSGGGAPGAGDVGRAPELADQDDAE